MARAVFVDKRDMPTKLYPYQFRVTGTFTKTMDGSELQLELHVELTNQEAKSILANECSQATLLPIVRDLVNAEVNRHLATAYKVSKTMIGQIDGKIPVTDPPQKE